MKSIDLISAERRRQVTEEGYDAEHDDTHEDGQLAIAAACYAAPLRIYTKNKTSSGSFVFMDPFPPTWIDKRFGKKNPLGEVPSPGKYSRKKRLQLLVKAGALIAAEIDRLLRIGWEDL